MMINIDKQLALLDAFDRCAQPFQARAIRRDDAIKLLPLFWSSNNLFRVEERELCGHWILVPARYFLPCIHQREGQAKLRADTITIGPHMANNADRFDAFQGLDNAVNDLGMYLH